MENAPYVAMAVGLIGVAIAIATIFIRMGRILSNIENLDTRHSTLARESRENRTTDVQRIAVLETTVAVLQAERIHMQEAVAELKQQLNVSESLKRVESGIYDLRSFMEKNQK